MNACSSTLEIGVLSAMGLLVWVNPVYFVGASAKQYINSVDCPNKALLAAKARAFECITPGCPGFDPHGPYGPCVRCDRANGGTGFACCPSTRNLTGYVCCVCCDTDSGDGCKALCGGP